MKAILALADGRYFSGCSFGAPGEVNGEVVFNTSMAGYQEILTDPSYRGEIVTMTYPQIGNYGINAEDVESRQPFLSAFVVKEACPFPSNWRSEQSLDHYLKAQGIVGIEGIDTRALVKHIRDHGAQVGVVSSLDLDPESLIEKARKAPGLVGRDLVREVSCPQAYAWNQGVWQRETGYPDLSRHKRPLKIVAYDFGIKHNILRSLTHAGCHVTVVPATTSAAEVMQMAPDGVFLSNGPGDPEPIHYAQDAIGQLLGKIPLFGICLGHQLLAIALGGKTYKLKFGHRGGNQPVLDKASGRVEITAQNHGFAVDPASLGPEIEISHINLNDQTVEGISHKKYPAFSVQYHPEASPGPHDAHYLFERFIRKIKEHKKSL
ncbi:MAG: glutamine-hydrolyzing carbamoyl-phosphate synthase small subunit [Deltaproteobacteria bacterium]|nr:glutamine-hydrolyzing carbamoyl-phosphate synthase small subunit [Deltaproteobacteria bacterium]